MGLLSKAAFKTVPLYPDEMGKILIDRILRIPPGKNAPDTALSLLKAYGSFHTGLCFSRSGDAYLSYASSGGEAKQFSLSGELVKSAGRNFFSIEAPEISAALSGSVKLWIFPLDEKSDNLLLLAEDGFSAFDPESLSPVIAEIRRVLVPPAGKSLLKQGQKKKAAQIISPLGVTEGISKYCEGNPVFQGIVFEMPDTYNNSTDFAEALGLVLATLGAALPLPSHFCLVLIPGDFDRELLTHRLAKSLKIKSVFQFKSNSPDKAIKLLHAYL
jgi:hypothetical protein